MILKNLMMAALLTGSCALAAQKPNIILLLADDAGFGDYQPYHRFFDIRPDQALQTPNIQKLADEGMLFTNGHCTGAVCQPSRYSIMSGVFSFRKQVAGNPSASGGEPFIDPEKRMCLGDMLKQAGYQTGMVGKWHLDFQYENKKKPGEVTHRWADFNHYKPAPLTPVDYGFDYAFWTPKGVGGTKFFNENRRTVKMLGETVSKDWKGHSRWKTAPLEEGDAYADLPSDDRKMVGDVLTDKALEWMEQAAERGKPFFLYFAAHAPHAPHLPAELLNGVLHDQGAKLANGKVTDNVRQKMVYENDIILGQLQEQLVRLGLEENTIVIFTADNGGGAPGKKTKAMGDFNGCKGLGYEGGNRIPMIIKWPGMVKAGSISDELISQVDFFKTFASAAGVKQLPEYAAPDSLDFLPVLTGKGKSPRTMHFSTKHKVAPYDEYESGTRNVAILDKEGNKLILHYLSEGEYEPIEFYRLDRDPGEKKNLITSPEFKITISHLVKEFDRVRNMNVGEG